MEWPKYYKELVLEPSPDGHIGIICGWTKKEKVEEVLDETSRARVRVIGQLYSKEGINYVIRNAFLNSRVNHLVISGLNLSNSQTFFRELLADPSLGEGIVHREIPTEHLEAFCAWFGEHVVFEEDIEKLNEVIATIPSTQAAWTEEEIDFPEPELVEATDFPSEGVGIRLEDAKVLDLWLKILDRIIKYGREKKSQYGEMQRELVGLVSVINDENPDDPYLPEWATFTREELEAYYAQVLTAEIPDTLEYTYGSRLRNHKGIDQISSIVQQIREEDYTRRACAFTWDVEKDDLNPKAPCLDLIQVLVNERAIHLTCYFRSNDMYEAWPRNALALRAVQKEIADRTEKQMGKLMIVSNSAHIYERNYEEAMEKVAAHKPLLECIQDPRGSFVINLNEGKIKLVHMDPLGRALQTFSDTTATGVMEQIATYLSDVGHALDLGAELQKAQIALEQGLEYRQDNPLEFGE